MVAAIEPIRPTFNTKQEKSKTNLVKKQKSQIGDYGKQLNFKGILLNIMV